MSTAAAKSSKRSWISASGSASVSDCMPNPTPIWRRAVNPIRMARRGSMRSRLGHRARSMAAESITASSPTSQEDRAWGERNRISTG